MVSCASVSFSRRTLLFGAGKSKVQFKNCQTRSEAEILTSRQIFIVKFLPVSSAGRKSLERDHVLAGTEKPRIDIRESRALSSFVTAADRLRYLIVLVFETWKVSARFQLCSLHVKISRSNLVGLYLQRNFSLFYF